jgi:hypothetical protein
MRQPIFKKEIIKVDPRKLKQLADKYKIPEIGRNLWLNELRLSKLEADKPAQKDAEILGIL